MRHTNRKVHNHWRRPNADDVPYNTQYIDSYQRSGFKTANSKKRYVKILQYVADHDGCKRIDIIRDVFAYKCINEKDLRKCRGQFSTGFSQLLYIDVIDYDKSYSYHITDRGREVLKNAYLNDVR